jgi:hypothetical protein
MHSHDACEIKLSQFIPQRLNDLVSGEGSFDLGGDLRNRVDQIIGMRELLQPFVFRLGFAQLFDGSGKLSCQCCK